MTLAEKLHQRAAALRATALRERAAAQALTGNARTSLLRLATVIMREAGATLRRARRVARSAQHGGAP